jgi:flagellar hook protein FlgE
MSSALTTSISGLLANQQLLDVVSNNIANTSTPGFKAGRANFADQFYTNLTPPTPPGGGSGGTDPIQSGNGALISSITVQFTQGPIQPTDRDLDLAITGPGLFRLQNPAGGEVYSRVGNFGFDGGLPSRLVDLATGFLVLNTQGQPMSPVQQVAAQATTEVNLSGNLPPSADVPLQGDVLSTLFSLRRSDGGAVTGATRLADTTLARQAPTGPVTVNLFGTAPDGVPYSGSITLDPNDTVDGLVDRLNTQLSRPAVGSSLIFGAVVFDQGNIRAEGRIPGEQFNLFLGEQPPLATPFTTAAANTWQYGTGNETYDWNRMRFAPSSTPIDIQVYTADGTRHTVNGSWVNVGTVTTGTGLPTDQQRVWDLILDDPVGGDLAPGSAALRGLTFNANGTYLSGPTSGALQTTWTVGGASSVTVDATLFTGFQAADSADSVDITGYPSGTLVGISFDRTGTMLGSYSNDRILPMSATGHQIGLAEFVNPGGLEALGNNLWGQSVNSGNPGLVNPGDRGTNTIDTGALEGSNVNISEEFTKLIVAQRGFQASSRSFQVGDDLMTEAFTLFR